MGYIDDHDLLKIPDPLSKSGYGDYLKNLLKKIMKSISDYYKIIEKEISNLNLPNSPEKLYDPIEYILKIGGSE